MNIITGELQQFIEGSALRNKWFNLPCGKLYARKGRRYINQEMTTAFDIATVEWKEKYRGKGYFKKLIEHLDGNVSETYLYVENVFDEWLKEYFRKNDWIEIKTDELLDEPRSFYRKVSRK